MALKYSDIEIGTAVGSAALRNDFRAHGSIQNCKNLFLSLLGSIYFISFLKRQFLSDNINNVYVVPSERYFLHSLFVKTIRLLGGNILDGSSYKFEKQLITSKESYEYLDIPDNKLVMPLSASDKVKSINYLENRLYSPSESLWYMFRGANNPNSKLRDLSGVEITTITNELYVVLFLHQFEDGQYSFGYDGFDDIFEWSIFTIDNLINNNNISKVFIKSHPNASNAKYPGDEIAIKNIADKYSGNNKVIWLDTICGPLALKNPGLFIGITKHGSIAEELAAADIFNISSVCSRWTDVYKFSKISLCSPNC
jgi:hypothetical protein